MSKTSVAPSRVLTIEEFLRILDPKNPTAKRVVKTFLDSYVQNAIMRIYEKDNSLYEVVTTNLSMFRLPIIDKPLQLVFEARDLHGCIMGALYAYHAAGAGEDPTIYSDGLWEQFYLDKGYGYYFTGAWSDKPRLIVLEDKYRPDRLDKDILIEFKR